jgi:hypothetical protein
MEISIRRSGCCLNTDGGKRGIIGRVKGRKAPVVHFGGAVCAVEGVVEQDAHLYLISKGEKQQ